MSGRVTLVRSRSLQASRLALRRSVMLQTEGRILGEAKAPEKASARGSPIGPVLLVRNDYCRSTGQHLS